MKKYLIINHNTPLNNLHTEEVLELMLTIASVENEVSILLLQNAAFQLLTNQQYQLVNRNLLNQTIKAFKLFEFKNIYIEDAMLQKFKKFQLNIIHNTNIIKFSWKNLNNLYKQHDVILSF